MLSNRKIVNFLTFFLFHYSRTSELTKFVIFQCITVRFLQIIVLWLFETVKNKWGNAFNFNKEFKKNPESRQPVLFWLLCIIWFFKSSLLTCVDLNRALTLNAVCWGVPPRFYFQQSISKGVLFQFSSSSHGSCHIILRIGASLFRFTLQTICWSSDRVEISITSDGGPRRSSSELSKEIVSSVSGQIKSLH
jgi:hypothetical protein